MTGENVSPEEYRRFHVGDILSITTGRMVSPRNIEGVNDILNYMTGSLLFSHQLPRVADECAPSLRAQHPDLNEVEIPEGLADPDKFEKFMGELATKYGEDRPVFPISPEDHVYIHPMKEFADMLGGADKVIVVDLNAPEQEL